ncbi:hypothetical protein L2E82_20844 [Cichorium intybus]|uniref:Uncharacterized protein n=1 Tax=Cichorium intybus TaxID=13427 RepID=A0ACB9DUS5_CICIN|nr:hypothetical protein L2E82_20844 [Cichorium intybus]
MVACRRRRGCGEGFNMITCAMVVDDVWALTVSNDKKGKYKYRNRKCLNIIEDSDGSSSVVNTEGRIRIARSGPRHQPFSSVERKKERWM